MRNLIIPCAGKSSRFTTKLPKWLLEHPSGNLMVFESIQGLPLSTFDRIIIVALKRHLTNELIELVNLQFKDVSNFELLLLENDTHSASDTVSQTIDKKNITGSIFIKDADDYFKIDTIEKNEVCTYSLNNCTNITPGNKSYIKKNDSGEVLTIVEKNVISSDFCCGLYTFSDAREFVDTYESIKQEGEIYISHVIFKMLLNGKTFFSRSTRDFIDWGTQEDWDSFIKKQKQSYGTRA
jgi:bifunctional N-acetylglucosamine-1-phosphate-uridyltransferase/glucosamine-1-phosphate-acetyltransferase GlmU-like protein